MSTPLRLTYVVTEEGRLRVADRHAEHVACAEGRPVLAAGELELAVSQGVVVVESITNQSTGYCPEPSCFPAAASALNRSGLSAPPSFAHEFVFRRCPSCAGISIVKEGDFECAGCGAALPSLWNFDEPVAS